MKEMVTHLGISELINQLSDILAIDEEEALSEGEKEKTNFDIQITQEAE